MNVYAYFRKAKVDRLTVYPVVRDTEANASETRARSVGVVTGLKSIRRARNSRCNVAIVRVSHTFS